MPATYHVGQRGFVGYEVPLQSANGTQVRTVIPAMALVSATGGDMGTAAAPLSSQNVGTANMATGQVAVGTTATLVAAARAGRQKITLSQTNAVASVYYVGNTGITAATGVYVASGGAITLDTSAAIYALSTTASTISYVELY